MAGNQTFEEYPIPPFYDPGKFDQVWRVPYQERARQAEDWAREKGIRPFHQDRFRIGLVGVDIQNTFCLPDFELFVGGRSGRGAVEDNRRLAEFIYRNLGSISEIVLTMDTHRAMQIFHPIFLVDEAGNHPEPNTQVTLADIQSGRWKFNREIAPSLGIDPDYGQRHLLHYAQELAEHEKFALIVWPYHSMLGGIGHALVSGIEEAVFFHTIARKSQANFIIKGEKTLTESYSAIGPEVQEGPEGRKLGEKKDPFINMLQRMDALLFAGQAKSHCVSWTVSDLLDDIREIDPSLAGKVYLLEDCTSPVVVPGGPDFSEQADQAFRRFEQAGMHRVRSTDSMETWPGIGD